MLNIIFSFVNFDGLVDLNNLPSDYDLLRIVFWGQFVADGVFFAELNEVLTRELAEDGYSGVEVRVTPVRTEIIIRATRTQNVLGKILIITFRVLRNGFELLILSFD